MKSVVILLPGSCRNRVDHGAIRMEELQRSDWTNIGRMRFDFEMIVLLTKWSAVRSTILNRLFMGKLNYRVRHDGCSELD